MNHELKVGTVVLGLLVVGCATGPANAPAQEPEPAQGMESSFQVDAELANKGKSLWTNKGCLGCHSIGKGALSGPDLKDVHQRRDMDWLVKYLTDTDEMLDTDPVAMELLEEYDYVRMPDLNLRESEAKALIHYIAQKSK